MTTSKILTTVFLLLSVSYGYSQDYVLPTTTSSKVEIVANTAIIVKTHPQASLLISSRENKAIPKDALGLKPVFGKDNTGFNVFVSQNNSTITVESFQPRTADPLVLYLPETIKISAESRENNDILISDFIAEVVAKTNRGDIQLKDVHGPVIVENARGDTYVLFEEVRQDSPISLVNSHGDIDVTLPSTTNATIEVTVPRGELFTDLDLIPVEAIEKERIRASRNLKSKLNNGGVSIMIIASYGNVYLRKK